MSKSKSKKKSIPKSKTAKSSFFVKYKQDLLVVGGVLLFTFFIYLPSLSNGWTNWDDGVYVVENILLQNHDWRALISQPFSLNYHPVTMLSLGVDHAFWGLDPFGYHLSNLFFHLVATALTYYFIKNLVPTSSWFVAGFTALMFGIHPLHVESVAWISERKDVLYVCFFLAGLISYLRYLKKIEHKYIIYAFLFFLLSVLSKAMAVVFPIVLLLLDWYLVRPKSKKIWIEKIPFLIVSIIFGTMATQIQSQGAIAASDVFSFVNRITFASYGFIMYLVKAIVPYQLSAFYPYPFIDEADSYFFYVMPVLTVGVMLTALAVRKRARSLTFGILFYAVTVVLVLQFISVGKVILADRYTYLPYIGVFFALGFYLDTLSIKVKRPIIFIISGVFALSLSVITFNQIGVWKDSETLWSQVISEFPNKVDDAYGNRGHYLGESGRSDEALADGNKALELNPNNAKAHALLGHLLAGKGQYTEAIQKFSKAITCDPKDYNHYTNRAVSYAITNQYEKAASDFSKAIELSNGRVPGIFTNRGIMYLNQGKYEEAYSDCVACQKAEPNSPANNYCLAQALYKKGNLDEARRYALQARKLGYQLPADLSNGLGL